MLTNTERGASGFDVEKAVYDAFRVTSPTGLGITGFIFLETSYLKAPDWNESFS